MKFVFDVLKGAVMGIANVIPGVSGGTMAVAMGIYDRLIHALTHIFKEFKKSVLTVLPIGIGMVLGIVGLSVVISWMFDTVPVQTNLLFIGLIIGGVPLIYARVKGAKFKMYHAIGFLAFFALVVGLSFVQASTEKEKEQIKAEKEATEGTEAEDSHTDFSDFDVDASIPALCKYVGAGVVASATMVIPGVSGSMMMMVMGLYELIIRSIKTLIFALLAGDMTAVGKALSLLVPFGIGAVVGIIIIAKLVEMLLDKCEVMTFYCIMGLIIGSPVAIVVVNLDKFTTPEAHSVITIVTAVVAFLVGLVISIFLGGDKEKTNSDIDREIEEIKESK